MGDASPAARHAWLPPLRLLLGSALPGCALAPGVPAGPIAAPGVHAHINYTYAYAPSTIRTLQPSGEPYTLHENAAMYGSPYPSPLTPSHVGLRVARSRSLDFGFDLGWLETGVQLRAGELDAARPLPWGVELEWRSGLTSAVAWFADDHELGPAWQRNLLRLRGELYPALPLGHSASGLPSAFGVLTLGASLGRELASIASVPRPFNTVEEGPFGPSLIGLRWETKLEASFGLQLRTSGDHRYTFVLMPWLTLYQGRLSNRECDGCSLQLLDVASGGGLALALAGAWQLD